MENSENRQDPARLSMGKINPSFSVEEDLPRNYAELCDNSPKAPHGVNEQPPEECETEFTESQRQWYLYRLRKQSKQRLFCFLPRNLISKVVVFVICSICIALMIWYAIDSGGPPMNMTTPSFHSLIDDPTTELTRMYDAMLS